jgi:hypothetical protein
LPATVVPETSRPALRPTIEPLPATATADPSTTPPGVAPEGEAQRSKVRRARSKARPRKVASAWVDPFAP